MTIRCRRPLLLISASFAIALLFAAPRSYARPQAELPPPSAQPQSSQQAPQSTAPNATPPSGPAPAGQKPGDPNNPPSQTTSDAGSKDRLFFALPNFLTLENSAHVPPMTAAQKYKVAVRSSFDYVQF